VEIEIRSAKPDEIESVRGVHREAFAGREEEPHLVALLHAAGKAPVSLIAVLSGRIVGHVMFSPMRVDPAERHVEIVGLAPVGVLPEHQGRGIGSHLIREGLPTCREAGYDAVVVLGEPGYYRRFGFERASDRGVGNEYGVNEPFMVLELQKGALDGGSVKVGYQPEFRESGL
jgi:putative acetyltransferase